jgi:TATA-box binding protein (TBP) (component of TFIID and TFIIIB)
MGREIEYCKTNHVMIVKTQGKRCVKYVFDKLKYGEHTPNRFSALTLKHQNPSATIIMFSTGNITIMGPETEWGAMYILSLLKDIFDLEIIHINIANIVVNFSHLKTMNIDELYQWNKKDCVCDVDLFPSCPYQIPGTTIKANFFNSGKVVVTGCNNDETVEKVIKHLAYVIDCFYKDRGNLKFIDKKLIVENIETGDEQSSEQTQNDKVSNM